MQKRSLPLLAAVALALGTAAAFAHAFLDRASPAVGSTTHGSPPEVRIWLTQGVEPAFSTIEVTDASGKRVDKGNASVDPNDNKQLTVSLPNLPPGTYKVTWRVTSVDTHQTSGNFTFKVEP
ncbi:MAG TPA: copper resistance CopC family protein [Alphaproteobacteria bacterium]|nr:copper resistance CopC family protein [Alphaproteobacteria bacterium]